MPEYDRQAYVNAVRDAIKKAISDKNVKVNVRAWNQATADNLAQSLRTKGNTVILAAHINGGSSTTMPGTNNSGKPRTGATEVVINGGVVNGEGLATYDGSGKLNQVNKEKISAENFLIFSCQIHPETAEKISKRMDSDGQFLYVDGGQDGETDARTDVTMAVGAAAFLGQGKTMDSVAAMTNALVQSSKGTTHNQGDERAIICTKAGGCKAK